MRHYPNHGKWCQIPLSPRRRLLKAMLSFCSHCCNEASTPSRHTHIHTRRLTRDAAAAEVDHYTNRLCCKNNSVFPLAMTEGDPAFLRKTLHPLDHDVRSKGELHGTGARRGDGPAISFQWMTGIENRKECENSTQKYKCF